MSTPDTLTDLVHGFKTAMLVTHALDDDLRARPMAVACVEDDTNTLWFATRDDSHKLRELRDDSRVCVTLQGNTRYVSLTGSGRVVLDAELIRSMWSETWRVWFPDGPSDDIALIAIDADAAEVWDISGTKGLAFALEAGKALITGERIDEDAGEHHRVTL